MGTIRPGAGIFLYVGAALWTQSSQRQAMGVRWVCRLPPGIANSQNQEQEEAPTTILEQMPRMIQEVKSTDNKRQQTPSLEQSAEKPSSLSGWATRASWAPGEEPP